ncbi:MAG: PAS domain S-box protein, partial [Desulfoferrobacter sp.]
MNEREKVLLSSIGVIFITAALVTAVSIIFLYRAAFEQEREKLLEIVRVQGRIIQAVAEFDAEHSPGYPGGPRAATFRQIQDAYGGHQGSEKVGEFLVVRREGDVIVPIVHHHGSGTLDEPKSIQIDSDFAEPLRRALSGQSGVWVGRDYRGKSVLVAYEPVQKLAVGLVAKTYLAEIQRPFIRAGVYAGIIIVLLVAAGSLCLLFIMNPFIRRVEESEARYRLLVELSPDLVAVHTDGKLVYVNPAGTKLFGASSLESLIGRPVLDFVHPDFHDQTRSRVRQVLEEKIQTPLAEISIIGLNGQQSEVEVAGTFVEYLGKPSVLLVMRDITQRKLADKEIDRLNQDLRSRITELQTIFDVVPIALAIAEDPQGLHIRGNPANERMLGLPRGAELSRRQSELTSYRVFQEGHQLVPDELPMQRAVRGETVIGQMVEVHREDGKVIQLYCSSAPLLAEQGRPRGAVGAFLDVTELKRAEDALRRSESRFRLLSQTASLLLASPEPQDIVNGLCRQVMQHLDCHVFFNFLVDGQAGKLHLNACAGIPEEEVRKIEWL